MLNRSMCLFAVLQSCLLFASNSEGQEYNIDASTVLKKYVDVQYASTPVTGEFRIADNRGGNQRFRWSLDSRRERLVPLDGTGRMLNFLIIDDTVLESDRENKNRSYSYRTPSQLGMFRPGHYGIFDASGRRWSDYVNGKIKPIKLTCKRNDGQINIEIKGGDAYPRYVLEIDEKTNRFKSLRGYDYKSDTLFYEVSVSDYQTDKTKTKFFPSKGYMELRDPATGKVFHSNKLEVLSIDFPSSNYQADKHFELILTKGTLVHDAILNQVIKIEKDTRAIDVFDKPSELQQVKIIPAIPLAELDDSGSKRGNTFTTLIWISVIGFCMSVLWIYFKKRRTR